MKVDHQLKGPDNDCIEPAAKKFKSADAQPDDNAETNIGVCNWCGQNTNLLHDKKFCGTCAEKGRECNYCHRPLHER